MAIWIAEVPLMVAMEYFDFSGVYMKEVTREEVKAAQDKLQSGDPASGF